MRTDICEPLSLYNIFTNDDDEVMIAIAGYYKGEPKEPVIFYGAEKDAVFQRRGEGQLILLDEINPAMRGPIFRAEKVLIKEMDTRYEYYAKVVRMDVDDFAKKAKKKHDYFFGRHPYPQRTGAFSCVYDRCGVCGKKTEVAYVGPVYPNDEKLIICPKCISTGRAAKKFRGSMIAPYTVPLPDILSGGLSFTECVPPIPSEGKYRPAWLCHCGKPSVYLGRVDTHDLSDEIWDEILANWDYSLTSADITMQGEIREAVHEGRIEGHLFRCGECQTHLMHFVDMAD